MPGVFIIAILFSFSLGPLGPKLLCHILTWLFHQHSGCSNPLPSSSCLCHSLSLLLFIHVHKAVFWVSKSKTSETSAQLDIEWLKCSIVPSPAQEEGIAQAPCPLFSVEPLTSPRRFKSLEGLGVRKKGCLKTPTTNWYGQKESQFHSLPLQDDFV